MQTSLRDDDLPSMQMADVHDVFDEFKHQLPDIDPQETQEWIESLDALVRQSGADRARFVMYKLLKRARMLHVGLPPLTQTRYINTISPEQEPYFPGDEEMELHIRRLIRWNAVAMVVRANHHFEGIGGHLATYASAASLYEVGFNHYLHHRGIKDTTSSRVWAFLGDGECDEPDSLGALHVAAREGLDNLTFVVNCNLQRLDGPVRGNGKIIQELESVFRGSGWNVIKVIWAREWDDLLARDVDGVLVEKMNNTLAGEL